MKSIQLSVRLKEELTKMKISSWSYIGVGNSPVIHKSFRHAYRLEQESDKFRAKIILCGSRDSHSVRICQEIKSILIFFTLFKVKYMQMIIIISENL